MKETRGHFSYRFSRKGVFLRSVFYLNIWCIEYTFRINISKSITSYEFINYHTLLLLVSKIFESLQCSLKLRNTQMSVDVLSKTRICANLCIPLKPCKVVSNQL